MLTLTDQDRELPLTTLHAAGIEPEDADTSLAHICQASPQATLRGWHRAHVGNPPHVLAQQYGHDAARAAYALTRHLPPTQT